MAKHRINQLLVLDNDNLVGIVTDRDIRDAYPMSMLRRHRIGSLPVVKDKQLVGIITRSDILDFVLSGAGIKSPAGRRKRVKRRETAKRKRTWILGIIAG